MCEPEETEKKEKQKANSGWGDCAGPEEQQQEPEGHSECDRRPLEGFKQESSMI